MFSYTYMYINIIKRPKLTQLICVAKYKNQQTLCNCTHTSITHITIDYSILNKQADTDDKHANKNVTRTLIMVHV